MEATAPVSELEVRTTVRRSIKGARRRIRWQARLATSGLRILPDFVIIGTQKGGTTSLHHFLSQHPQIHCAAKKEIHFFDRHIADDPAARERSYRAHFPLRGAVGENAATFEATPCYMHNPRSAERMHALVPGARLVALLRDPVERAVSHYSMARRAGQEDLPLLDALTREEERLGPSIERGDFRSTSYIWQSYKKRGLYAEQLERFLKFFDRDQILVLSSHDLLKTPLETFQKVCQFVGVNPDVTIPDLGRQHVDPSPRNIEKRVYDYLRDYFERPNRRLYELVGRDFGW